MNTMNAHPINISATEAKKQLLLEVKSGTHKQFFLNEKREQVECRCGHVAIWWRTGYLCGSITAYPCSFN